MEKFRKLGIIEPILKVIQEEKFETPTEIQEKAIPLVVEGKDIIAQSATGSGKTLVFAAGIIKGCEKGKGLQSLILTPTRELAEQIMQAFRLFSKYKHLEVHTVYGGVSINPQIHAIRTADVVVGTPGRLLDHIQRGTIRLDTIHVLVLDEADRMLDMGFIDDVEQIIRRCSMQRQTLLFSATMPSHITGLANRYMTSPIRISAESFVDPNKLAQFYYDVGGKMKFSLLVHLLKAEHKGLVMIFCNTIKNTNFVANNLRNLGINAIPIHGGLSQDKRTKTMQMFNSEKVHILVCTDVAARGLDIKGVSHIYNYDVPKDSKEYVHRIGRTARAGKEGKVVNLLAEWDYENFRNIVSFNEVNIQKLELPHIERAMISFIERPKRFGNGNFRPRGDAPQRSRGFAPKSFGRKKQGFGRDRPRRGSDDKWAVSTSSFNS